MVHWTEEEEIELVTSIVDAQRSLRRGQTAYWTQAFQQYQHVENACHNLKVCQHNWYDVGAYVCRLCLVSSLALLMARRSRNQEKELIPLVSSNSA
ncbi:hypothetical protein Hanom_Chr02g00115861 [Helianthus anomalus]